MKTFYIKNDIGVPIEYTIIGQYLDDDIKYIIYTDFVEDKNSAAGIRLYVAKNDEKKELVSEEKKNEIINAMHNSLIEISGLQN